VKAAVGELKARLSEYLRKVKSGHEVVITERGVPVAKVVPLAPAERRDSRRDRLARAGVLVLGRGRVRRSLLKPPRGSSAVGEGVLEALLDERQHGR
jgi:prevent-host-death family protein